MIIQKFKRRFMKKNILVIGPGRAGKTTLAKMIHKELGYSINSIDDIVCSLEAFPELGISSSANGFEVSLKLAPFVIAYIKELTDNNKFSDNCQCVIEGIHISIDQVIPNIDRDKTLIIGLTYNELSAEDIFNNVRKYDTEDDWSYWVNDEELKKSIEQFVKVNKTFTEKFQKYNIPYYDTSVDRSAVFKTIIDFIKNNNR